MKVYFILVFTFTEVILFMLGFGFLIHLNVDGIKQIYLETPQSNVR